MEEIQEWFDLYGYENSHQITKDGRIRSKDRQSKTKNGYMFLRSKEISQCLSKSGYVRTMLTHDNVTRCFAVHRLVALTFIPNPKNKPDINHKNGRKADNRVENLEWCTKSENMKHSYRDLGNISKLRGRHNFTKIRAVIQLDPNTGGRMKEYELKERICLLASKIDSLIKDEEEFHGKSDGHFNISIGLSHPTDQMKSYVPCERATVFIAVNYDYVEK